LNLARIKEVEKSDKVYNPEFYHKKGKYAKPLVIQINQGRNTLERCMLHFADMEKQTEYDEITNTYICKIFYDSSDETEVLVRVLSFGHFIKVLEPEHFLNQIKERIEKQVMYKKFKDAALGDNCK
jgi:hypothetical protein